MGVEKKLKCEQCPYATSVRGSLQRHMKAVHEKVRPYKCDKCSHAASTKQNLHNHVNGVHEKTKP